MGNPVAWWQNAPDSENYTIWYQDPFENGVEEGTPVIPLYEGWEDEYNELQESLAPNQRIRCTNEGEFEVYEVPYYEPPVDPSSEVLPEPSVDIPEDVWSQIAEAVRNGINSY